MATRNEMILEAIEIEKGIHTTIQHALNLIKMLGIDDVEIWDKVSDLELTLIHYSDQSFEILTAIKNKHMNQ